MTGNYAAHGTPAEPRRVTVCGVRRGIGGDGYPVQDWDTFKLLGRVVPVRRPMTHQTDWQARGLDGNDVGSPHKRRIDAAQELALRGDRP